MLLVNCLQILFLFTFWDSGITAMMNNYYLTSPENVVVGYILEWLLYFW